MPRPAGAPDDLPTVQPRRGESAWSRDDSLVVLASYVERPRDALVPPQAERERVASLLGHDRSAVTRRLWMFAALDPDSPAAGEEPGERERRLWHRYADDRVALMVDAEDAVERRKARPRRLYGEG